jgi:transcriptional antiterminator RfaH
VLKIRENPPILTPDVDTLAALRGTWWVAHTRARNEKALAWDLLGRGVGYFLPMRERVFFSGGRRRRGLLPLFTSYVFFCGNDDDRLAALRTNRVCRTLDVADQNRLVDELTAIEKALLGQAVLEPYAGVAIGQRCRIVAGPFRDIEGVVVERGSRARLVLNVGLLGQGAAMEIEADLLEPIE